MVEARDKKVVDNLSKNEQLKLWCDINIGNEPSIFEDMDNFRFEINKPLSQWTPEERQAFRSSRSLAVMNYIDNLHGHKEVLRYANVILGKRMNNEEFEDFWAGSYEGDKEAENRNRLRFARKYAQENNMEVEEVMEQLNGKI